jgi:hypothetical protein
LLLPRLRLALRALALLLLVQRGLRQANTWQQCDACEQPFCGRSTATRRGNPFRIQSFPLLPMPHRLTGRVRLAPESFDAPMHDQKTLQATGQKTNAPQLETAHCVTLLRKTSPDHVGRHQRASGPTS